MSESSASPVRKSQMGTTEKGSVATGWLPLGRPRGCSVSGGRRRGMLSKEKKSVYKHFTILFLRTHSIPEKILLTSSIPSYENPFLAE